MPQVAQERSIDAPTPRNHVPTFQLLKLMTVIRGSEADAVYNFYCKDDLDNTRDCLQVAESRSIQQLISPGHLNKVDAECKSDVTGPGGRPDSTLYTLDASAASLPDIEARQDSSAVCYFISYDSLTGGFFVSGNYVAFGPADTVPGAPLFAARVSNRLISIASYVVTMSEFPTSMTQDRLSPANLKAISSSETFVAEALLSSAIPSRDPIFRRFISLIRIPSLRSTKPSLSMARPLQSPALLLTGTHVRQRLRSPSQSRLE